MSGSARGHQDDQWPEPLSAVRNRSHSDYYPSEAGRSRRSRPRTRRLFGLHRLGMDVVPERREPAQRHLQPHGGDKARQYVSFNAFDSSDPRDLWNWLDETSEAVDTRFIAIPHNANVSNGLTYSRENLDGTPITAAEVAQRIKWEPVPEMTQIKGDVETHPCQSTGQSANDGLDETLRCDPPHRGRASRLDVAMTFLCVLLLTICLPLLWAQDAR